MGACVGDGVAPGTGALDGADGAAAREDAATSPTFDAAADATADAGTPADADTPRAWLSPMLIGTSGAGSAVTPHVAVDGAGNAMAVWQQHNGVTYDIRASRYTYATGTWSSSVLIDSAETLAATPNVAVDDAGDAIAVWRQDSSDSPVRPQIWANRFTLAGGWGTAVQLEAEPGAGALFPRVVVLTDGSAVAAWQKDDGTRVRIMGAKYIPGAGWTAAGDLQASATDGRSVRLAKAADDSVGMAWREVDGAMTRIHGVFPGQSDFLDVGSSNAADPRVAGFKQNGFLTVWVQDQGATKRVAARPFLPDGGAVAVTALDNNAGVAVLPKIAANAAGDGVAVWHQSGDGHQHVWANRLARTGGWTGATLLENDTAHDALYPQVGVDSAGNAIAVWQQSNGTEYDIWATRCASGGPWAAPQVVEIKSGQAVYPELGVSPSGSAVVVWEQDATPTRREVWAAVFR